MTGIENFGLIDHARITILVDNKADRIVESNETVEYFRDQPLLAEHGFSALIHLEEDGPSILWDAGVSSNALIENMSRMQIDPDTIDVIVLSHGHRDHYAALSKVLSAMTLRSEGKEWEEGVTSDEIDQWIDEGKIRLVAHPAAFRERWWVKDDGTKVGPYFPPPARVWETAGAKIILSEEPYPIGDGCWTTGYIPRRSFEGSGRSKRGYYREADTFQSDDLEDDQALVIHIKDKGLIVLAGCAHAGIVNTVERAVEISGQRQVWGIIGGFHLARADDDEVQTTVDHIKSLNPKLVVPSHCTGFTAMTEFASQMPDAFIEGIVGATYIF